ncbi:alpha-glucosidase [Blautia schinkii]|nr:alpha-glucosidase [Blautia schinkii]
MVYKYLIGNPVETQAVVMDCPVSQEYPDYFSISTEDGFLMETVLGEQDLVYGLGENVRGINKRGWIYESSCCDEKDHDETKSALYSAHNFLIIDGVQTVGIFIDTPGDVVFDIGYTRLDRLSIRVSDGNLRLYVLEGDSAYEIAREFRRMTGQSYAAPRWAFGYQQSRWGYGSEEEVRQVVKGYQENHIPLDAIGMDIDYMERYKDFTVDRTAFPDFEGLVKELKEEGIRLVPIIDAAVKIEEGYDVYEEGIEKGYFCKNEDGSVFEAGVWPGWTHFPDVLNDEARQWFGEKYKMFLDMEIEGFWNDMNEPAIFYSREELDRVWEKIEGYKNKNLNVDEFFDLEGLFPACLNNRRDYERFYHEMDGVKICHKQVHNLYGYYMTRAASQGIEKFRADKRTLLFSRSSYIGMHRYAGIWTGDNKAWWSHILLNLKMLPSLNMCGFLYVGADLGGFAGDCTKDLLMRWIALGIFTPLMRNHARRNTRRKECYQFENPGDFRNLLKVRYALIPYLYSEYMKAVLEDDLMFRPLAFDYRSDDRARKVEDQLMLGKDLMIAPVYEQNADGRYVYLPEDMVLVRFRSDEDYSTEYLEKGHHYVEVKLTEVPVFIKKNHFLPVCSAASCTDQMDTGKMTLLGAMDREISYRLYEDDGYTQEIGNESHITEIWVDKEGRARAAGKELVNRILQM